MKIIWMIIFTTVFGAGFALNKLYDDTEECEMNGGVFVKAAFYGHVCVERNQRKQVKHLRGKTPLEFVLNSTIEN
jgi:hypothetical protein